MKFLLITCCLLLAGSLRVAAATGPDQVQEKPEITKLEVVELGEGADDAGETDSDVQRKRDSGYDYKRPEGPASGARLRLQLGPSGIRGRIVHRRPVAQINRPVATYGPPGGHRHSSPSSFADRPAGLREQEVPSPIRHVDFVEPNPISSQNNRPFATHSANYLPPQNQKLPVHSVAQPFSAAQPSANVQIGDHPQTGGNFHSENIVRPQAQISDAAAFLSENAQAIQQLYSAPANEQDFAPQLDHFRDPTDQLENLQFGPQTFPGPLPSYASGTVEGTETLRRIQSLEKDRLIVELQRALATQARNADAAGRYAENQPSIVQSQDFLASLGQRVKFHGSNAQQSILNFGSGDTAPDRSPFFSATTPVGPAFPLSYGLSGTAQPAPSTTTATTTTTTTTTVQPPRANKGEGTSQVGSSVAVPPAAGVPVYGGFVPTLIAGPSFVSNVPAYGTSFFAPSALTPVQTSGSSPTHFGLPIPTDPDRKPGFGATPPPSTVSPTPTTPSTVKPGAPSSPPVSALPVPVFPVAAPLHPVVTPLKPVLPVTSTHVHPAQGPAAVQPTYGVQTSVIDSLLYKPVKPVYPFYYYPNVAYQLHKPVQPTYPWSYAPTYAQAKPTQIWK